MYKIVIKCNILELEVNSMYINLDVQTDFEIKSLSDLKKFKELMVNLKMKINKSQLASVFCNKKVVLTHFWC